MSQYAMPKKVMATAVATVRWKCPVTQMVLCTRAFIWWLALMMPPMPPGMKATMPMNGARNPTSFQGRALNHPNSPLYPMARPVVSNVANSANAVMSDGTTTAKVRMTCRNFQNGVMPGSMSWWWKPTGTEKTMNRMNASRASASLNILPPMTFGTTTYQQMYTGMSQKYTSGWPKYQNSVRLSSTLILSTQPKDQGMNWNSTVAATPSVATYHSTIVATAM